MTLQGNCKDCGFKIQVEGPDAVLPELCQRCDPAFSSLLDNKHHGRLLPTTSCRLCDKPTRMLHTKLCDGCWELERRIQNQPEIARKILDKLNAEETVI